MTIISYIIHFVKSIGLIYSGYLISRNIKDKTTKFYKRVDSVNFLCDKYITSNTDLFIKRSQPYLIKIVYEKTECHVYNFLIYRTDNDDDSELKIMSNEKIKDINLYLKNDILFVRSTSEEYIIGTLILVEL